MTEGMTWAERLRKKQEENGTLPQALPSFANQVPAPTPDTDADLVPQVYERNAGDELVERTVSTIQILDAYVKWIGKTVDMTTIGQTEGLKVSCPKPSHPDSNPSAWLNTEKRTWFCGACQEGGDIYDMAAFSFGYEDYKAVPQNFHRLREAMAESFGTHTQRAMGETLAWRDDEKFKSEPVPEPTPTVALPSFAEQTAHQAPVSVPYVQPTTVTELHAVPVDYDDTLNPDQMVMYPKIDWRSIVKPDTFLWEYMTATSNDDSPEEYHFWHGLIALGHAVGRRVTLDDDNEVYANLMLCLLGGTGAGKSKSRRYLKKIVGDVLPFKDTGDRTIGVKAVSTPGSGEVLIGSLSYPIVDPTTSKPTGRFSSVNGMVDFDEFSNLLARSGRMGSSLSMTLMQIYDASERVTTTSVTGGEKIAYEPYCSVLASTQPKSIRNLVDNSDASSGFLNRWVFAGGPLKEKQVLGGQRYGITINLDRSKDQYLLLKGWGSQDRLILVDQPVRDAMENYFKGTIFPLQQKDESDLLARLDLVFKKILLLLTINNKEMFLTMDTLDRAKPLMQYIVNCFALISENIGVTISHEIVADIMRHIANHYSKYQRGATPRDLDRYMHRKKYPIQLIKSTLESMEAIGLIEKSTAQAGAGRPAVRYVVVSA